tara:strand:+ start:582 stop:2522 length:1941 start_codon:yes stop_codon:yes gene_type:complete
MILNNNITKKSINTRIIILTILSLFLTAPIFSQNSKMSTEWINVKGRSGTGIKEVIKEATRKVDIYVGEVIEEASDNIARENDARTNEFNNLKTTLRADLNLAIDDKNSNSITVNDLKDEIALKRSELMNFRQKIKDADSSIVNSRILINDEKKRIEGELLKIPFYEVIIGKVTDFPPNKDPIPYEDAIASSISKKAIEAQLGLDIIKKTIVKDGTLENEAVTTMLKGKANTNLTRYEDQRKSDGGQAIYDLYRFGLVAVYPFQKDDLSESGSSRSRIKVDVELVDKAGAGMSSVLDRDKLQILNNLLNDKKIKNSDSESQVKRLARTAKQLIRRENGKIKASQRSIDNFKEKLEYDEPILSDLESQLIEDSQILSESIDIFNRAQVTYMNHVANEEYVTVFPGVGQATPLENKEVRFAEIAANTYEDFITSIKSEYLKEETRISRGAMTEIKESKKSDIILNKIKIVGKFSEERYGKINLITYVAYNFGFEFEEIDNKKNNIVSNENVTPSPRTLGSVSGPDYMQRSSSYNLSISSSPSGAKVSSGRKELGTTPLNVYLEPGLHSLTFRLQGYKPNSDVVEIISGKTEFVNVSLLPKAAVKKKKKKGKGLIAMIGGAAVVGGALFYLSQQQEEETGSVSISVVIP